MALVLLTDALLQKPYDGEIYFLNGSRLRRASSSIESIMHLICFRTQAQISE